MFRVPVRATLTIVLAALVAGLVGCYESTSSEPAQAQSSAPEKTGPLTNAATGQGSSNSALGGAKRAAGNIASQAEEASRKTAEQAEHPTEDH